MAYKTKKKKTHQPSSSYFLYGQHAVLSASNNPLRHILHLFSTPDNHHASLVKKDHPNVEHIVLDTKKLDALLPPGTPHQGIILEVLPLPQLHIEDWLDSAPEEATLLMLDQITDPHNVGAIMRSSVLFNVSAIIMPKHHAPQENGAMAKAASGALDIVPILAATNLSQAINTLKKHHFWVIGLDQTASMKLEEIPYYERKLIVLGSEGKGIRPLVKEHCDITTNIPIKTHPFIDSLNVSNATSIALYTLSQT